MNFQSWIQTCWPFWAILFLLLPKGCLRQKYVYDEFWIYGLI